MKTRLQSARYTSDFSLFAGVQPLQCWTRFIFVPCSLSTRRWSFRIALKPQQSRPLALHRNIKTTDPQREYGNNAASWKQSATSIRRLQDQNVLHKVWHDRKGGKSLECGLWNDRGEKAPQDLLTQQESLMCAQSLHCYCYLLERLINIWAYHSGRRMLHVNVDTVGRLSPANFAPSFTFRFRMHVLTCKVTNQEGIC